MSQNWSPHENMLSLDGKVAVVTGATSGIGFHTVKHLAAHGAKVYFTARSEDKARKTQAEQIRLNPELSPEKLPWVLVDFEDIEAAVAAATTIRKKETKVDILVNNAGGVPSGLEHSKAGWERSMTSSHIGHFVFTNGILPLLKQAAQSPDADVRVVVVSSNAQHVVLPANFSLDFTKPDVLYGRLPYEPYSYKIMRTIAMNMNMLHYAVSKLANAMFAKGLQDLMKQQGLPISVVSVHPGGVRSDDVHTIFKPWVWALISRGFVPTDVGSFAILFAATSQEVRDHPDTYLGNYMEPDRAPHPGHPLLHDAGQVQGLWDCTQKEVEAHLAQKKTSPMLKW